LRVRYRSLVALPGTEDLKPKMFAELIGTLLRDTRRKNSHYLELISNCRGMLLTFHLPQCDQWAPSEGWKEGL
jgi:hypothetical protein